MIKNIGLAIMCVLSIISTNVSAGTNHILMPDMTLQYEFPPEVPQYFSNILFWTVKANCVIATEEATPISAKLMKKSGSLNGSDLPKNEPIYLSVKNKDVLHIVAASGAKVELINLGSTLIKAACTA